MHSRRCCDCVGARLPASAELLHQDIKPSNIIFVNGFPQLADTGLVSEISQSGRQIGTMGFIPPEGAGTPQSDVYSLGKVLYEMSTGRDRNDYPELPERLTDTAEDRNLLRFNKIVLKACRSDAKERYQSAEELQTALVSFEFFNFPDPARRAGPQSLAQARFCRWTAHRSRGYCALDLALHLAADTRAVAARSFYKFFFKSGLCTLQVGISSRFSGFDKNLIFFERKAFELTSYQ